MTFKLVADFVARIAIAAGFAAAAVWSVRVGSADFEARKQTVESTEAAVRWMPDDADNHSRLAALLADRADAGSVQHLQRAVELNPWDSHAWIELGLYRETHQDLQNAERCFLRAADADRLYIPRWTLANFYFRHDNLPEFQRWAKAAAQMVYGDAPALFRLCAKIWDDGALIDRLDIRRPDVRAEYLAYLLTEARPDLVMPAARKVIEDGREPDVPLLLSACDRLLEKAYTQDALEIWNRLAEARRIPLAPLDPKNGRILTDGRLGSTSLAHGFAWMIPAVAGVSASAEDSGGLRLTFSGSQPEQCELLSQTVPVEEDTEYELKYLYRTAEIAPDTGLAWRVTDPHGAQLFGEGQSLSSDDEQWKGLRFRIPAGSRLARLAMWYGRKPGTARISGYIVLKELRVDPAGR